ncbi:MAG: hypothetical protein O1I87_07085 [Cylindrospermopsis raciborskii PAMP2012]|nr:hypothetical protein [Cylindrospermopsis raciborskii PAMP2012]MCZ2205005.1 hypothetical protein [Cylindrospermopsis raciborskii PAMP2011]
MLCFCFYIAFLVTGCSQSKVSQCQQLLEVVSEGSMMIDQSKGSQVSTSLKLAQDLGNTSKSIKKLHLTDPQLQKFQSDLVQNFAGLSHYISKAAKSLSEAKKTSKSPSGQEKMRYAKRGIESSLTTAEAAGKQLDILGNKLNKYCNPNK